MKAVEVALGSHEGDTPDGNAVDTERISRSTEAIGWRI